MDISTSCIVFVIVLMLHSILHRMFLSRNRLWFGLMGLYPIGGALLVYLYWFHPAFSDARTPLVSLFIYTFASLYVVLMYIPLYLKTRLPPSSVLLRAVEKGACSYKTLRSLFDEEELIDKRINDLIRMGYVKKKNHCFISTGKGIFVYTMIRWYEKVVHWSTGG